MAAGKAMLDSLTPAVFAKLEKTAKELERGMNAAAKQLGVADRVVINRVGSILTPFFTKGPVRNFDDAKASDLEAFKRWFHSLLSHGVFVAPAPFEAMFVSTAHTPRDVAATVKAHEAGLRAAFRLPAAG
jgi:glutamate-1-semialdehyde 2,1-aminomutase